MKVRYYGSNGNVIVETDGNMQCAHFADFANVQESDCAFGGTDIDAVANLALAVRDAFPAGSPRILDAAPELLELLEDIEKELHLAGLDQRENNAHDVSSLPAKLCIRLHEVIQKAKGESC